jgi:hypothetical protein
MTWRLETLDERVSEPTCFAPTTILTCFSRFLRDPNRPMSRVKLDLVECVCFYGTYLNLNECIPSRHFCLYHIFCIESQTFHQLRMSKEYGSYLHFVISPLSSDQSVVQILLKTAPVVIFELLTPPMYVYPIF